MPPIEPNHTADEVDEAGWILKDPGSHPDKQAEALAVVDNWRAAHDYPLNAVTVALRNKVLRLAEEAASPVRRLKRLPSIRGKLQRIERLRLSEYQDIGGCRAVLPELSNVYELVRQYESGEHVYVLERIDDRIRRPKPDGYRCVHLIFRYASEQENARKWSGLRVEMQLRTQLQHDWATAIETVDSVTNQGLKSGGGRPEWKRFFLLVSGSMAAAEGSPMPAGITADLREVRREIADLDSRYGLIRSLDSYRKAVTHVFGSTTGQHFVLELDPERNEVREHRFGSFDQANEYFARRERDQLFGHDEIRIDRVLTSGESIAQLRRYYPNYYHDVERFVGRVKEYLG